MLSILDLKIWGLIPYITQKSPKVFLATSKLFLKVINEDEEIYKTVIGDFVQRIQPQLRKFLKDPVNVDFHCALLRFVDEIMKNQDDEALNQLSKHYKDFKLLPSDRTEVCLIKCKILQKLYGD